MGYSSRATGNITITPPLTWGDISDSPYLPERVNRDGNWRDVQYVTSDTTVNTDQGQLAIRVATGVEPCDPDDSMKRYDVVPQLAEIVSMFPDRQFSGAIYMIGEDGDRWRCVVRDGAVIEQRPTIVWPDGDR